MAAFVPNQRADAGICSRRGEPWRRSGTTPQGGNIVKVRTLVLAVASTLLVALGAQAAGAYVVGEIEFVEQRVWLHAGAQQVGNAAGTPIGWDTTAPTASGVTSGG